MAGILSVTQWSEPAEAKVAGRLTPLLLRQNAQGRWTLSTTGPAEAELVRNPEGRWVGETVLTGETRLARTSAGKLTIFEV